MCKIKYIWLVLIALMAGGVGGYLFSPIPNNKSSEPVKESAYERVMKAKSLRCGYVVHPPHVIKEAGSGALSGVIVDIMNEAGRLLDLKIEWVEEVGWGTTVEAMRSGRVDAICTDYWMNPVEGRFINYSMPLYYGVMGVYVRADDNRFDGNIQAINDPSVTISGSDGSLNIIVAQQEFPRAKIASLPNMTDFTQNIMDVVAKKADLVILSNLDAVRFAEKNPGKLKNLVPDRPIRAFPSTIALPQGDMALKTMIDSAFVQLLYGGFVEKALNEYNVPPEGVYRVARPFEVPEK